MKEFASRISFQIIARLAFGVIPIDEKLESEILDLIARNAKIAGNIQVHELIPIIPYPKSYKEQINEFLEYRNKFYNPIIDKHKEILDPNNPKDFMDILLANMDAEGWKNEDIMAILLQTFLAGSETSSFTASWVIAYLIKYPEAQKQIHAEIDLVIGKERFPEFDDSQKMPYFNAVLNEVMRIRPVAPEALYHRATEDFTAAGYLIKKNTILVLNIYNICHNTKHWKNPESFIPERFLNWDAKNIVFSPFGYGPRICAGQKIAKVNVFYILINILQKFEFYSEDNNFEIPSWTHLITLSPNKFSFKIRRR